jgi:prophage antirepressor-like protein
MDILKAFSLLDTEYQINIQGTLEDPLFQSNQIGKMLGISNIRENMRDFSENEKGVSLTDTSGGKQEMVFLTEMGLYRVLGRSRKPIAHKFQQWMVSVLKEIRINGMYKLQQDREVDKQLHQYKCDVATHKTLLKAYAKKNVVYICKFHKVDDKFIIKIGSTQDIKERLANISKSFNCQEPLLLDIFENNNYSKFERKIHRHEYISKHCGKITKVDGTISRETYLVDDKIYQDFIAIINQIKPEFAPQDVIAIEELKIVQKDRQIKLTELKIQQLQIEFEMKKMDLELKKIQSTMEEQEEEQEEQQEEQEILVQLSSEEDEEGEEGEEGDDVEEEDEVQQTPNYIKKRNNGSKTPKIYQYNLDDLTNHIKVFDSPSELERTLKDVSLVSLKRASQNNTIYKNFRWLYIGRDKIPPTQIEETVASKHKSPEVKNIAMIDIKKTKILAVYSSQKEAIVARNMKCNSFTRAIQQESVSSGHYWNFFDDCSEEMKTEYLKHNSMPEKLPNQIGIKIQRIDPFTKKVLSVYNTKRDVVKKYQISYAKLNLLISNASEEIYNGFIWKLT